MLSPGSEHKIYLAKGVTDLRKSFNGLSILVKQEFELDPYDRMEIALAEDHQRGI